jgi:hypothetical protein
MQWRVRCDASKRLSFFFAAHEPCVFLDAQRYSLELFWEVVRLVSE